MTPGVAGVVLSAGLSRRMGRVDKLLVNVEGSPMVRRVVEAALGADLAPVIVVVGPRSEGVRDALADLPVSFAVNPLPADGLSSSLRVGIEALAAGGHTSQRASDVLGAAILLGDMPWVTSETLRALVEAFDVSSGREICVPVHGGRRGNPVLWGHRYFPELVALSGDRGARPLLDRHAAEVWEVVVEGEGVLRDVDTPEALETPRVVP